MRWPNAALMLVALAGFGCALDRIVPESDESAAQRIEPAPASVTTSGRPGSVAPQQYHRSYVPEDWPASLAADVLAPPGPGPYPAVLLVHGSDWARGDCRDLEHVAQRLVREGFVTVCPEYRLAPEWRHPAPLEDLRAALRWIATGDFPAQVDPGRVAVLGYASGGHLAALLGLTDPGAVRAIVAGGTPFNLMRYENSPLLAQYLGARWSDNPGLYAEASPLSQVDAGDPPVFIYHGGADGWCRSPRRNP